MARYSSVKEFRFSKAQDCRAVIPESGVSIKLEFWSNNEWVEDDKSPITVVSKIYTAGLGVRLTPPGGAFFIDEADKL